MKLSSRGNLIIIKKRIYDCLGVVPAIENCCGPLTASLMKKISNFDFLMVGDSLAVDPIAILAVLIPIVSLLMGSNCYVKPDPNLSWEEPVIFFSLLIGKKGSKKTPILKTLTAPLDGISSQVDLIFLDGTLEGLTSQLSVNKGEILQVSNEAEAFFNRLYSVKGKI